ncbi:MAG: cytochrome c [Myxococcota bacterium]|nr:cytochrome c [Myxococcota bacterium]
MRPALLPLMLLLAGCSGGSSDSPEQNPPPVSSETDPASPATESQAPSDPGEAIYKEYCIVCHQADGSGKAPGSDRAVAGNFSGQDSVLNKSDQELLRSIKVGRSGTIGVMPPWRGVLDEEERKVVLGYIRASFGK